MSSFDFSLLLQSECSGGADRVGLVDVESVEVQCRTEFGENRLELLQSQCDCCVKVGNFLTVLRLLIIDYC